MAQGSGDRKSAADSKGSAKGSTQGKAASRTGAASRKSVAAARTSKATNNRTQLIIGAVAIVVIIAVVVIGVVMNRQQTAVQGEGYGPSTDSVATVQDGVVRVSSASATDQGATNIGIFEDALCPICAEFETQFGQQINQAVDEGRLSVDYHMLTFLNGASYSGDYSTRAAAATLCVAQESGSQPGVYLAFHSALFNKENQPAERGSADLTNAQLADLAVGAGAPQAADCINSGTNLQAANAASQTSSDTLSQATGRVATPTVLHNGAPVQVSADWLTTLLGQA